MFEQVRLLIARFCGGLIGSAAWLALSSAASRGILVISGFVISRSFGVEIFSLYSFLIATVAIVTVFSNFGLGLTATKIISDPNSKTIDVANFIGTSRLIVLMLSLILSVTVSYSLEGFAGKLIGENGFQATCFVFFAIILYALIGIESSILIGCKEFKAIGLINFLSGAFQLGLILFFSFRKEFGFVLASTIFTALMNYIFVAYHSKRSLRIGGILPKAIIDEQFIFIVKRYSFPLFLSSVFYAPTIWLASTVVINSQNGTTSIGYFYAADNLRGVLLFFAAMIAQASLPYLSEYSGEECSDRFQHLIRKILILVLTFTSAIVMVLFFLTPFILSIYGLDYDDASRVMFIVLLSSVFVCTNNIFGQVMLAKNRTWEGFLFNFIWSVSLLVLTVLLSLANLTIIAMPLGLLFSYVLMAVIQYRYITRNLGVKIFMGHTIK